MFSNKISVVGLLLVFVEYYCNAVPVDLPVRTQSRISPLGEKLFQNNNEVQVSQHDNPAKKAGTAAGDSSPHGFLGSNVHVAPYDNDYFNFRGGGPADEVDELNSDFGSSSCWDNAKVNDIKWEKATSAPDHKNIQLTFGANTGPDDDYLIAYSKTKRKPTDSAKFESCSISCVTGDLNLSLKHWSSSGVILSACIREVFFDDEEPGNCQKLPSQNQPGPVSITFKNVKELSAVVIKADNFIDDKGGIAIIDDVKISYTPCAAGAKPASELPKAVVTTTAATQVDSAVTCQNVACTMQRGLCSYKDFSEQGKGTKKFSIQQGKYHNAVTGIQGGVGLPERPSASFGKKYAAAYLLRNDVAGLESEPLSFVDDRILRFNYYLATQSIQLKVCFDATNCPVTVGGTVNIADRNWKEMSVRVPKTTKKIAIISQNTGVNEGAVGITDIKLMIPDKPTGNEGTNNACPNVIELTILNDQRDHKQSFQAHPNQLSNRLPERRHH